MMTNCSHNVIQQLSIKLDSVWRYEQYIKDAEMQGHPACAELWRKIKAEEEEHITLLRELLVKKCKTGDFK